MVFATFLTFVVLVVFQVGILAVWGEVERKEREREERGGGGGSFIFQGIVATLFSLAFLAYWLTATCPR